MRMECEIIRDLMPLYAEKIASVKSGEAVEEHLQECAECRRIYENMLAPAPQVQFQTQPQESFQKYVKRKKRSYGLKVALITLASVLAIVVLYFTVVVRIVSFLVTLTMETASVEVDTDVTHYERYMGDTAEEKYRSKLGVDDSIFPQEITADMKVLDYKMVYYDPWDPQYLSYLAVEYGDADYAAELERLAGCAQEDCTGFYGAQGFAPAYEVLAMEIDEQDHHGLVYALGAGDDRIVYVELLFCNYFMDLEYEEYIDAAYLPVGFDAASGNAQRREIMGE